MNQRTLKQVAVGIQANVPMLIIGGPGIGKTTVLEALSKAMARHHETIIASYREPSDFGGLPVVTDSGVVLAAPAWAKRLAEVENGVLFIDEISTCPPAVQAALLRVILDRVVGELPLPKSTAMVAAMNPPENAAGGQDMAAPLSNRFCHLNATVKVDEWVDGMMQGFPEPVYPHVPEGWEAHYLGKVRLLIASFIQFKQTALYACPTDDAAASKPWPSPRSWVMASRLSAACQAANAGLDVELPLIAGCVGEGLALEYTNWRDALDLPDPEALLKDPKAFILPERGDKAYTVLASVALAVANNMTKPRYLAAWEIAKIAADGGKRDIAATAVKSLCQAAGKAGYMGDPEVRKKMAVYVQPYTAILQAAGLQ